MTNNEHQAELFDRLQEAGLTAKVFDIITQCGLRQAYRIMTGDGIFTAEHAQALLRDADPAVADLLADELCRGTGRMLIQIDDRSRDGVDVTAAESLRDLAAFMDQRARDRADGVITEAEQQGELDLVNNAIRDLYRLKTEVEQQRVAKQARALKIDAA